MVPVFWIVRARKLIEMGSHLIHLAATAPKARDGSSLCKGSVAQGMLVMIFDVAFKIHQSRA